MIHLLLLADSMCLDKMPLSCLWIFCSCILLYKADGMGQVFYVSVKNHSVSSSNNNKWKYKCYCWGSATNKEECLWTLWSDPLATAALCITEESPSWNHNTTRLDWRFSWITNLSQTQSCRCHSLTYEFSSEMLKIGHVWRQHKGRGSHKWNVVILTIEFYRHFQSMHLCLYFIVIP